MRSPWKPNFRDPGACHAKLLRAVPDQPDLNRKSVTAAHDATSDGKLSGSVATTAATDFVSAFRFRVSLAFFAASLRFCATAFAFLVAAAFTAASLRFLAAAFAFLVATALFAADLRFRVVAAFLAPALRSVAFFIARSITGDGRLTTGANSRLPPESIVSTVMPSTGISISWRFSPWPPPCSAALPALSLADPVLE